MLMNRNWFLPVLIGGSMIGGAMWYRRKKRRALAWSVENTLEEVEDAHAEYLRVKHPAYLKKFQKLQVSNRDAARAEAAVFALLRTYFHLDPQPADDASTGGVDFICHKGKHEGFVVEVTSLNPDAVASRSGIPTTIEDDAGGPFRMATNQLHSKVCDKAPQLGDYPCPRVLVITSSHHASFLIGTQAAEFLLTSEPTITYQVGGPTKLTTSSRRFAFFTPDTTFKGISAVLLVALSDYQSSIVGLLYPEPAHKLNIEPFRDVPFLRLAEWPIVKGAIRTEWVVPSPESRNFLHAPIIIPSRSL
jgi:hypothetical protein